MDMHEFCMTTSAQQVCILSKNLANLAFFKSLLSKLGFKTALADNSPKVA